MPGENQRFRPEGVRPSSLLRTRLRRAREIGTSDAHFLSILAGFHKRRTDLLGSSPKRFRAGTPELIGAAYNSLGRYEEAAAACEQALRYKPDFELARNNLSFARQHMAATQPK